MKKLIALILSSVFVSFVPAFALREIEDLTTLRDETVVSEYAKELLQECYEAKLSEKGKNLLLLRYQLVQLISRLMSSDYE